LGNFTFGAEGLAFAHFVLLDQLAHMIHNLHVVKHEDARFLRSRAARLSQLIRTTGLRWLPIIWEKSC
jgi:hypothetical protein